MLYGVNLVKRKVSDHVVCLVAGKGCVELDCCVSGCWLTLSQRVYAGLVFKVLLFYSCDEHAHADCLYMSFLFVWAC
jgi:hypothetical protein